MDMDDRGDDAIRLVVSFPKKMNLCMKGYADKYLRDTRIKPPYLILIFHIGKRDGLSQKELIDEVPYDKSYISTMVHDLIDLGLVYNDSSGKLHSLHLTDQGRDEPHDVRTPGQEPVRRSDGRGEGGSRRDHEEARRQGGPHNGESDQGIRAVVDNPTIFTNRTDIVLFSNQLYIFHKKP